jgi:two-component system sensor histidine kinase ChvG
LSLRRQLLVVSLLLLSLPWAGCQFVREMEGALRQGQEQSLQATAQAVAAVLGQREELLYPNPLRRLDGPDSRPSLFAQPAEQPLIVDGYGDGWEDVERLEFTSQGGASALAVSYQGATRNGYLYLLLRVRDPQVIYHNPGLSPEPNGDRLLLRTWQSGRRQDYVIATAAPGSVRASAASTRHPGADSARIRGYWQDAAGGYTLELEIPLDYTGGRLGFYLMNVGSAAGVETLGNITALDTAAPPWLIFNPAELQDTLAPFSLQGQHIQVVDKDNWQLADSVPPRASHRTSTETFWLLRLLYRSILSTETLAPPPSPAAGKLQGEEISAALSGKGSLQRYRDPDYASRTLLSAAAPVVMDDTVAGVVVVRQSGEEYLSLTDQAFGRLLGYSLLAVGIGAFGLLAYASLLSWRIGKLSKAARNAIREDGVVLDQFPRSDARDEIGELSRGYADLLDRLREYNDYLRTLSRKLSHELRTPIAVIQTSLENLEQAQDPAQPPSVYLQRARVGLSRLNNILTAMSEANRLEESIRNNTPQAIDLVPLLREVFDAYRSIYPQHVLALELEVGRAQTVAVPELLVQALDKLLANAADFCPPGGQIELRLAPVSEGWLISVRNEGPGLPTELQDRLFEPMVSLREKESGDVHLGLGLHVVRLIVDFHGGRVWASNLADGSGVGFNIQLAPLAATRH